MEWITIATLIAFGLALVVVEIVFIPGTTIVGIIGFSSILIGVGICFRTYGAEAGWITLGGTSVVSGLIVYVSFTSSIWKRFSHKTSINSKVNEGEMEFFKVGMEGVAISALRPFGKAELSSKTAEVKTSGEYVESNTKIKIIRIASNQIIVEPIK